jgi:hypothetical protein
MDTKNSKKSIIKQQSNKKDFFISYNHKDEDAARWIPELMMWTLYSEEINNKFPFPRRIRNAS